MGPLPTPGSPEEQTLFDTISAALYAGALSDILDEMGYRSQAVHPDLQIRPLNLQAVAMGRALTLLNARDTREEDPYELAIRAMDGMKPGQLLVASGKGPLETGIFGELSATRVSRAGGRGAVINGYSRDARKILEMGFPLFCRGISPIDTTGRVRVVDFNCRVDFGDQNVSPGQILFADLDGIILIPIEAESEVMDKALERALIETKVRMELRGGATMEEVWKRYHVL
jgi:4-hydroxy-4-methyl-2-oxoglutarate aldolase